MTFSAFADHRLLVPRWRTLAVTLRTKELAQPAKRSVMAVGEYSPELVARLERWRLHPSLVTAAELVEAALIDARESEAVEAARRLISNELDATPLIKAQAVTVLRRAGRAHELPAEFLATADLDAKYWRSITRINPRDPLAWVELAFHQTVRGAPKAAEKSMKVALQLAPDNRHVIRSAGRLLLHLEDRQQAHDLLAKSAISSRDPWIIAAEIAVSKLIERAPRFYKAGVNMIGERDFLPGQTTELAGSIGTLLLLDGDRKRARRMFDTSMLDPTGSALAQGEWAALRMGSEVVTEARLNSVLEASEAKAFHLYRQFKFDEVPAYCEEWADADPFSIRPFEFAATSANFAGDFELAAKYVERALKMRPNSPSLLSRGAFSFASLDRTREARALLKKLPKYEESDWHYHLNTANSALCEFRDGNTSRGIELYRLAIDGFRRIGRPDGSAIAATYLAREARRSHHADATAFLGEAEKAMAPYKASETAVVLARLKAEAEGVDPKALKDEQKAEHQVKEIKRVKKVTFATPGYPAPPRTIIIPQ